MSGDHFPLHHESHETQARGAALLFPLLEVLQSHKPKDFVVDLLAGFIISVVLIPETIAYASLAGLPPEMGLYTAIVAFFIYALVGPSRQLVVAPVSVISLMVAATLVPYGLEPEHYIACAPILALVSGVLCIALGVMRAGFLENFISHPVLVGFTTAAALIVAITQLPHLLGIHPDPSDAPRGILHTLYQSIIHVGECNWVTLIISLAGLAAIAVSKRINPLIPGPLVNVLLGVLIVKTLGPMSGMDVEVIGEIKGTLPRFELPRIFDPSLYRGHLGVAGLVEAGVVIGLVAFMETLSISKIMAGRTRRRVDVNRELVALGLSNLGASFFFCYPAAGSFSKSSVSYQAGTRSQWAALAAVGMVVLTVLFLAPLLAEVPKACLAAIVMTAVYHLIDIPVIKRAFEVRKSDGIVMMVTFLGTLIIGVQKGILLGITVSFGFMIWQMARPRVTVVGRIEGTEASFQDIELVKAETWIDLLIIKVEGPLYFTSANQIENTVINLLADNPDVRTVILDAGAITDLDISGEKLLWDLLRIMILKEVHFLMAGMTKSVGEILRRSGFHEFLGPENCFHALPEAVEAVQREERAGRSLP